MDIFYINIYITIMTESKKEKIVEAALLFAIKVSCRSRVEYFIKSSLFKAKKLLIKILRTIDDNI